MYSVYIPTSTFKISASSLRKTEQFLSISNLESSFRNFIQYTIHLFSILHSSPVLYTIYNNISSVFYTVHLCCIQYTIHLFSILLFVLYNVLYTSSVFYTVHLCCIQYTIHLFSILQFVLYNVLYTSSVFYTVHLCFIQYTIHLFSIILHSF